MFRKVDRRDFLKTGVAAGVGLGLSGSAFANENAVIPPLPDFFPGKADAMILIWLPGGIAQTDTWDPKKYTPYAQGMRGNEILGT